MTDEAQLEPPLWTVELTLIPSEAAIEPEAKEALRGIKARRRKGDPLTCCCCPATLGAAPFILVLGRSNYDAIPQAEAGLCRRCGPDLEAACGKAVQIVRAVWQGMSWQRQVTEHRYGFRSAFLIVSDARSLTTLMPIS